MTPSVLKMCALRFEQHGLIKFMSFKRRKSKNNYSQFLKCCDHAAYESSSKGKTKWKKTKWKYARCKFCKLHLKKSDIKSLVSSSCAYNFGHHFLNSHDNLLRLAYDNRDAKEHQHISIIKNINGWMTDQVWTEWKKRNNIDEESHNPLKSMPLNLVNDDVQLHSTSLRRTKRHQRIKPMNAKNLQAPVFNQLQDSITDFICSSYIPFQILQNKHFKNLLQVNIYI